MKYCQYCGTQLDDTALFCPNCGARVEGHSGANGASGNVPPVDFSFRTRKTGLFGLSDDGRRSGGVAFLCFLFWWAAIIFYFAWRDTKPGQVISAIKGAAAGICFGMPIAGLIIWIICKQDHPEIAKACGISAIVGAVFSFALTVAFTVLTTLGIIPMEVISEYVYFEEMIFASVRSLFR